MRLYAIEKKMSFCAAHILDLEDDHPCSTIHGHNYNVNLRIESNKLSKNGFVIDFNDLKGFKEDFIDGELDHSIIFTRKTYNKLEDKQFFKKYYILPKSDRNTTVEILARHIHLKLIDYLAEIGYDKFSKVVVRVSETDNNVGEYTEIDVEEEEVDDTDKVTNAVLEDRIDNLYEQLEELDGNLEEKFDEIEEKLDHLKNVCDELEEETDNNNSDLTQLKEDVLNIDGNVDDLEGRVEDIENILEIE